ncbi:PA2169 family four-helix-bundle protein [Planctomicrobium sp. SH668]|uniref:PA2169 family four-helix-bundle protein n=1 Tax=Planctomicrobium sp. SH668 TaxID=3448126 RepID=UPI003F5B2AE2
MALETKTNLKPETIKKIRELVQLNVDSRDGFEQAAKDVEDMTISTLFQSIAHQRREQAEELCKYIEWNHEEVDRSGSLAASMHRSWMSIRELFSTKKLYSILAECERGEDHIKQAYEETLLQTAGSAMNDVLTHQYAQVKTAHDRMRDLRDEHKDD